MPSPVLILGAGINGAAIARELVLNRVPVCVVDRNDIASGATAYSSRLIHGGLRYLEYGEFDLVRESLVERERLLRLAPQFVRPLRLSIPVQRRWSGLWSSASKFLLGKGGSPGSRGQVLVRLGLSLYDWLSRGDRLPRHRTRRIAGAMIPAVDSKRYRWLCDYWDAQIVYPERFTLALLEDARRAAGELGVSFEVFTHSTARRDNDRIQIVSTNGEQRGSIQPSVVINATGAWLDFALAELPVASPPLMAPTKGSHLVTRHAGLRGALGGEGVYTDTDDGRAVFILPLGEATLIGTTDIPFNESPEKAVASDDEVAYLIDVVRGVFPQVGLSRADIDWHYCGVRPLPRTDANTPGGITRRHWLHEHKDAPWPLYSVIGGKLTTCRSLAESTADSLLARLGLQRMIPTRDRPIPGGEEYPQTDAALAQIQHNIVATTGWPLATVQAVWSLYGTRTADVLCFCSEAPADSSAQHPRAHNTLLDGTFLPATLATYTIRHEWARTLGDLVERRLMLLHQAKLNEACLRRLTASLIAEGHLPVERAEGEIESFCQRLAICYGKKIGV